MPAIRIEPNGIKKGTIVIHGGFDSFIEEFYRVAKYLGGKTQQEIILFDGPGQGGALHKYGLTLINEWEKPVTEILNYIKLKDVTLIGVSLGGYLCIRAAAFESRISRVVCYDAYYDFEGQLLGRAPFIKKLLVKFMVRTNRSKKYNKLIEEAKQNNLQLDWGIDHMSYVTGKITHFESTKYMLTFSAKKISSKITQDVLLLAGEDDHLIPIQLFEKQKKALKNARTITSRIFTSEEHASAHCQVGNLSLALNYIADWINSKI